MTILGHRRVDADEGIETVDMDEALAVRPRHCRVHLGNHPVGDRQHRRREVDGDAEAGEAAVVERRHLEQRHVDRQPPARQELRHLLEADRDIVEMTAPREVPHVAADEEGPMTVPGAGGACPWPSTAAVVRKLTNSRSAGPGRIASSAASSVLGAAQPVPT